jgi:hypothetical protein
MTRLKRGALALARVTAACPRGAMSHPQCAMARVPDNFPVELVDEADSMHEGTRIDAHDAAASMLLDGYPAHGNRSRLPVCRKVKP